MYGQQKANIVLDQVMYLGETIVNCLLRAHNKPFCISSRKGLCMDDKKTMLLQIMYCNILTKNNEYMHHFSGHESVVSSPTSTVVEKTGVFTMNGGRDSL